MRHVASHSLIVSVTTDTLILSSLCFTLGTFGALLSLYKTFARCVCVRVCVCVCVCVVCCVCVYVVCMCMCVCMCVCCVCMCICVCVCVWVHVHCEKAIVMHMLTAGNNCT